jgi:hypothetical protein
MAFYLRFSDIGWDPKVIWTFQSNTDMDPETIATRRFRFDPVWLCLSHSSRVASSCIIMMLLACVFGDRCRRCHDDPMESMLAQTG